MDLYYGDGLIMIVLLLLVEYIVMIEPFDAIANIPGWNQKNISIEVLKGGLTNRTFKLVRQGEIFVLRLDSKRTKLFNLNRQRELKILKIASQRKLAPEIVYEDAGNGILLTRYINGRIWSTDDLKDKSKIKLLVTLLHRIHNLPIVGDHFNAHDVVRYYMNNLKNFSDLHTFGKKCRNVIDNVESGDTVCCCHNDVVLDNIISDSNPVLLDWEYASGNNPLFDLASLVCFHNLNEKTISYLLDAYMDGASISDHKELREQIRIYNAIYWLWLASMSTINSSDWTILMNRLARKIR